MKSFKLLAACLICFLSCTNRIESALDYAGTNRSELERVLEYFRIQGHETAFRAAKFIVSNMPGHKSMYGRYDEYFDKIDSLFSTAESIDKAYNTIPVLSESYGESIGYGYDSHMITADYLIEDIERSLTQWREGEWAGHLDFEEFCEWLLPYTCSRTRPLDNWRSELEPFAKGFLDELNVCDDYLHNPRAAICRVNDILIGMISKQKWIHNTYGHPVSRPQTFIKLPGATCEEYAEMAVRIMRSKGIPVGIDFTPQWPDRLYGHYWCVFPNLRGKTTMFNPFSTNPDYPHYSHAEFPKVYRRTYAPNKEYMSLLEKYKGDVPSVCRDVFFKDVTEEYMRTADVKVSLLDGIRLSRKDVYIAVFDNKEWKPIFWGKACFGKAHFKGMGRRITYIAMGYVDGQLCPVTHPFYLDSDGNIREIVKKDNSRTDIHLSRKYPMFQHVFKIHEVLHGGYIEADNRPDFKSAEKVVSLPQWSLTSGHEIVAQKRPYRYWRLCSDSGSHCDMAELFFYDSEGNLLKPVNFSYLADGDPLTNYCAEGDVLNEYLDFGQQVTVEKLAYIRRGDGNPILPGDEYEVYYWDDSRWNLHSHVVADDIFIDVKGLPSGALYYIKGLSRGVQTRIFTWDEASSKIVWH